MLLSCAFCFILSILAYSIKTCYVANTFNWALSIIKYNSEQTARYGVTICYTKFRELKTSKTLVVVLDKSFSD